MTENTSMTLHKGAFYKVKETKIMLTEDVVIGKHEDGFFILNFWEQCGLKEMDVFPAVFAKCADEQEAHELFKTNIIYGRKSDLCSI